MNIDEMRKDRKKQHIEEYLQSSYKNKSLLEDVYIGNNSLPELSLDEIDTGIEFLGKHADYPIMINAMTGGTRYSKEINEDLSHIAKKYNIPIAVGSQTIAMEDENSYQSFQIVREIVGPEGIVIANLNANATIEEVKIAMDIVDADAIQLHLNPAQELVMEEGDRDFKGVICNIETIVKSLEKPVIIKEVGFGISKDVAKKLYDIGIKHIDISGKGGTNFIEIESRRNREIDFQDMFSWGIPTALSLIECKDIKKDLTLIASGGIKTSMDIVKSISIGADLVGISGELLSYIVYGGYTRGDKYMNDLTHKVKLLMLLTGSRDIEALKKVPYKIKGELKDLI